MAPPRTFSATVDALRFGELGTELTTKLRDLTKRVRAHKIVEDAVRQMREAIEAQTGLKTINGTPS